VHGGETLPGVANNERNEKEYLIIKLVQNHQCPPRHCCIPHKKKEEEMVSIQHPCAICWKQAIEKEVPRFVIEPKIERNP